MIQEEFSRLVSLFEQAVQGKNVSVDDVFYKSLEFVELLKEQIKNGDEEDRKAAIRMMNELYEHMKNHTQMICKREGITEEQLIQRSENPANFSPEQWKRMQDSKQKLAQSGQQLAQLIKTHEPDAPPSTEKKEPKRRKGKKSQWIKS
jgi:hypothetical protein